MLEVCYEQLARVEDRLWWHEARRELVRMILRDVPLPENATALDVGCGTGGSLDLLAEYSTHVIGIDYSPHALEIARRKHPRADVRSGDANTLTTQFEDNTFDLVTMFNVLYHEWINDDTAVLRQACQVLKPGGVLLVTDAAFECLFRRHDRMGMGRRRYTLRALRRLMQNAGFEWMGGTYFNAVSLVPAWLLALWDRWHPDPDPEASLAELEMPPAVINQAMQGAMACERLLLRVFGRIPLGVSLLSLARKSDKPS